jgi:hypothetical protein
MVFGKVVPTLRTVDIGNLHASEASSADWRHLKLALRAEMNARGNLRAAVRAGREQGLAEQEVDDRTDATRQDDHDQHPEASRHAATLNIAADIPDEQDITGERRSPGVPHEQSHGQQLVLVMGQNAMKKILYCSKYDDRQDDGPCRDEAEIVLVALRSFRALISVCRH